MLSEFWLGECNTRHIVGGAFADKHTTVKCASDRSARVAV